MSLLALPAMWVSRPGDVILQIMLDAAEKIVPFCVCHVHVELLPGHGPVSQLRIQGAQIDAAQRAEWDGVWGDTVAPGKVGACRFASNTPIGPLRLIRLDLAHGGLPGHIWFGSDRSDFPTLNEHAVLTAAASLAATGLNSARVMHDRAEISRLKDEFLAMLAHELRNPLAPISAAADILMHTRPDAVRTRQIGEVIGRQIHHMNGLIADLMDVSRVTRGVVTLNKVHLDLKSVISEAVDQVRHALEEKNQHLTVDFPAEALFVVCDRMRLIQVMANLLGNAAKYTQAGGEVALVVTTDGPELAITLTDNGMGMCPALVTRVFDLFAQAERSSDRSQGGLGIGLSLVRSIIEMHGGTVTAASAGLKLGSTFSIHLSRAEAPGAETLSPEAFENPGLCVHNILIVDDNIDAADMLAMLFESAGHFVVTEHSSEAAIARSETFSADICVLDIGLPDIDGYALVKALQKMPTMATAVMVAVTGYGQPEDKRNAFAAGFHHHFVKPVEAAGLLAVVDCI